MYLKVMVDWRRPHSTSWLFVLVVEFALLAGRIHSTIAEKLDQSQTPNEHPVRDELASKAQQQVQEQKCVPMLNIVLPRPVVEDGTRSFELDEGTTTRVPRSTSAAMPHNFTFSIGDIDVPVTQAGSPFQSAMRLLSSFESSFDGDDYADDELAASAGGQQAQPRENSVRFVHNKLHISHLNLTMLNFHLYEDSEPRFGLGVNIGNATLAGKFFYDGLTPSLLGADLISRLAGHYRMSIDNVLVTATSNVTKLPAANRTNAPGRPHYRLVTNDFKMNISNLGYISIDILDAKDSTKQTSNYVLKMLQRVLQKTIKRTYNKFESYIRETLEVEGRRFLDCELTRFSPILVENQHVSVEPRSPLNLSQWANESRVNNLDDLARIISSEIRNSRLNRVAMPNFEYQRSVLGTSALIVFTDGSLTGLDNLRLLGETKVKIQQEHLIVNASLGWFDLRPQYNWTLYLGNSAGTVAQRLDQPLDSAQAEAPSSPAPKPTARGFVGANIKAIEFDTLISRSLGQSHSRVTVDELTIRRLEGPKMDIGGLPGMNRLTRGTVNFFMARLKQRLVSAVQPSLKSGLERVLNSLATPAR